MRKAIGFSAALLGAVVLCSADKAAAWNCQGHEMVAAVAWPLVQAKRARIATLLGLNSESAQWTQHAGAMDQVKAAFIQAACWADDIKGDSLHQDPANHGADPFPDQNIGYSDPWRHREWHYNNITFTQDGSTLPPDSTTNAETRINDFRAALASNASDEVKSYDLVWLIHLVGDAHQPLHATSRVIGGKADTGGNDVCLGPKVDGRCPNLHAYWDDIFGNGRDPAVAVTALAKPPKTTKPTNAKINDTNVHHWLTEGEVLAESTVYAAPIGPGLGPYPLKGADTVSVHYRSEALKAARARVQLAGPRLAKLINENLM
jgi:hypothetical protein